jgi:hypothetical protein
LEKQLEESQSNHTVLWRWERWSFCVEGALSVQIVKLLFVAHDLVISKKLKQLGLIALTLTFSAEFFRPKMLDQILVLGQCVPLNFFVVAFRHAIFASLIFFATFLIPKQFSK